MPPPQRPAPSRAGCANLFSAPPPPLSNRRYPQHRSLPIPPLPPRRRRHPNNHDDQPSQAPEPIDDGPRGITTGSNPAFRAAHLRTAYRKPVPPAAAAGEGEALLAADPADAASGRAVAVRLPVQLLRGAPRAAARHPGARLPALRSADDAAALDGQGAAAHQGGEGAPPGCAAAHTARAGPPQTVSAHGIMMEVRGRRQRDLARVSPGDGRTREEVLGEQLTPAEEEMA